MILILILIILIILLSEIKIENFITDDNVTEKYIYTDRYLSLYYLRIIQQELMDLEKKLNIKTNITVNSNLKFKKYDFTEKNLNMPFMYLYEHLNSILKPNRNNFNVITDKVFLINNYYYATQGNLSIYRFPLVKTKYYNTKYYYSKYIEPESKFNPYIYLVLKRKISKISNVTRIFKKFISNF